MRIEKEVMILDNRWKLLYTTYKNTFGIGRRMRLYLSEMSTESSRAIELYSFGGYYFLNCNHVRVAVFQNVKEAKINILKFLLNDNF